MNAIEIHEDTFCATLPLDQLVNFRVGKLRKLFSILFANDFIEANQKSIEALTEWLPEELVRANDARMRAMGSYAAGWRQICGGSRSKENKPQAKINRQLITAVKRTKRHFEDIKKLQDMFMQIQNKYTRR